MQMTETKNDEGQLHSFNDQPAKIDGAGIKYWYKNGKLHRGGDRPAEIWADGRKYWYQNGIQHRDGDQPLVIWADGTKFYGKNGKPYRDGNKPVVEYPLGFNWIVAKLEVILSKLFKPIEYVMLNDRKRKIKRNTKHSV